MNDVKIFRFTEQNVVAIGLSDGRIDFEAVKVAARIANIDQFITEELPSQYQALVGGRGISRSGVQLQRIGITRALYHDSGVLVFDEASSALDGSTKNIVLIPLEYAAQHKT